MQVQAIDERHMVREQDGAAFVVFIYYGGEGPLSSWAVDSRLITDADLPEVMGWLTENLPADCCWSLGLVRDPVQPTAESRVDVHWIVGSDVLNMDTSDRSPDQQRIAEEMLDRRHRGLSCRPIPMSPPDGGRVDAMRVTTRAANDSDLPFLRQVDRHVPYEVLAEVVSSGRVLVAELDGAAVGCLRWGLFWDAVPFMNLLFVVPECRGERVGTTLVETWEEAQRAAGHSFVLTSTVAAETAQHLYRRLGYVDTGALLLPGEATELILRKDLS